MFWLTLQRCVEEETSSPNKGVANKGNQEDCIMAVLQTISYAFAGKVDEHEVREGVDDLCSIRRNNIVLCSCQ